MTTTFKGAVAWHVFRATATLEAWLRSRGPGRFIAVRSDNPIFRWKIVKL